MCAPRPRRLDDEVLCTKKDTLRERSSEEFNDNYIVNVSHNKKFLLTYRFNEELGRSEISVVDI